MAQAARKAARVASTSVLYNPQTYTPNVALKLGPTHNSRLRAHYDTTVAENLMYMHYQHHDASYTPPQPHRKKLHPGAEDGSNPYAANRPPPRPRGNKVPRPLATNVGFMPRPHVQTSSSVEEGSKDTELANAAKRLARTVTHLKAIQLHIMSKDSLTNKASLITNMFQLRVLSGATKGEGGHTTNKGVELIRGRKNLQQWKLRRGTPCGVKVTLKGDKMYDFLGTLIEFVLPRLREWGGVVMPVPSANRDSPSMTSGVVSFGLSKEAVELFPQIEVNLDLYPRVSGMHIHFMSNERGRGAQNKTRALLSGFQIPDRKSVV